MNNRKKINYKLIVLSDAVRTIAMAIDMNADIDIRLIIDTLNNIVGDLNEILTDIKERNI